METKERIQKILERRIEKTTEGIECYAEVMQLDYIRFFENYAERVYKSTLLKSKYNYLLSALDEMDINAFDLFIKNTRDMLIRSLLDGALQKNSTSSMSNIAFALGLETDQEMIRLFDRILDIIDKD